jgi:hypothetical protein
MFVKRFKDCREVLIVYDNRNITMVLGCRPNHRRSANINILYALIKITTRREGFLERVKVHHKHIYGLDVVFCHSGLVCCIIAYGEQPTMNTRMERLDTTIHHIWIAG